MRMTCFIEYRLDPFTLANFQPHAEHCRCIFLKAAPETLLPPEVK